MMPFHARLASCALAIFCALLLVPAALRAEVIHVGQEQTFTNIEAAAAVVQPGDSIFMHPGTYAGDQFMGNLQGEPDAWITIYGPWDAVAVVEGGSQCWHLTDARYVRIQSIHFRGSSSNLVNIDDGGTYDTPAHNIAIEYCSFSDGNPNNGNADMLKMSGVDSFLVASCQFTDNRSTSGSGIDMVGCHNGVITGCTFQEMGSNSIQAKGGSRAVRIERCSFRDGGARAINMGGSTGEAFFRPIDINYEASHIDVFSNIFVESGPVSFVGCVQSRVINNTFFKPLNWALRILQETTREGFLQCADNTFRNNILYFGADVADYAINVGPNTQAETFIFSNNLWYNYDDPDWNGPNWPVTDVNAIVDDPRFTNPAASYFHPLAGSPAISNGLGVDDVQLDHFGQLFNNPRSIGAIEGNPVTSVRETPVQRESFRIEPNPSEGSFTLYPIAGTTGAIVYSPDGREVARLPFDRYGTPLQVSLSLPTGVYMLAPVSGNGRPQLLVITK